MENILITGGAGFIGSHLCKRLLYAGNRIICVDNFITGKRENIKELLKNPDFKLIEHDIANALQVNAPIDKILHFASLASPKDYSNYPIKTLKAGALGTHNCLGLAKKHKSYFILASSSEIYGDPEEHPQKETYWGHGNPIGPRGCYDESKRFAESLTMAYHSTHGINVKIIRIFNTYGPFMRKNDGRVMPNFINQALNNQPLTIYGDGIQTRSFCYIDDLIDGIIKILYLKENTVINLGNPKEVSMLELSKIIIELTKSRSPIKHLPLPQDEPKRRQPDISRAKELINFSPEISLDEGLQRTIDWFKQNKS